VIGTGADGALPVMREVHEQARRRVDLVTLPTAQAISVLAKTAKDTDALLYLTCRPASAATASTAAVACLLLRSAARLLAAGVRLAP
jgi:hypothetical protein